MTGYKESSKHKILTREEEVVLGRAVVEGLEASKTLDENKSLIVVSVLILALSLTLSIFVFFYLRPKRPGLRVTCQYEMSTLMAPCVMP